MINIDAPLNSLSLGQVTINILKQLHKRQIDCCIFPYGGHGNLEAYDLKPEFVEWLKDKTENAYKHFSKKNKTLKIWHIENSDHTMSNDNFLYTFHELDNLTPTEIAILNSQQHIFTACDFNKDVFNSFGVENVTTAALGLSDEFFSFNKRLESADRTVWFIGGKLEKRKAHIEAIRSWISVFGNSTQHKLILCLYNPFIGDPGVEIQFILQTLGFDRIPHYMNFLPFTKKNSDYNQILNACDIAIDMSRGESFSLPAFQAVGIGKHAIVHNNTGMKQWANEKNSVLVTSNGKIDPWDNRFFAPGRAYNQGKYFDWDKDQFEKKLQDVYLRSTTNRVNTEGLKIKDEFTWEKTVDKIVKVMDIK